MTEPRKTVAMSMAGTLLKRGTMTMLGTQAVVIAALVATDAIKKHYRSRGNRFPRPGSFEGQVSETRTKVFTYGEDLYEDMIASIRGAKHTVLLETYIWKNDSVGQEFKEALTEAAERGVDVYVIYDGFANLVVRPSFFRFHPKINVYRFPVLRASILLTNIRGTGFDHRKVLVVDDEIGYVGGYNIGAMYASQWRDTHLRIMGRSVWELREAFAAVWNHAVRQPHAPLPDRSAGFWEPRLRAVNNIPSKLVFPIRGLYLDSINRAMNHIYITTAYFIPDQQILGALLEARARGVDVRVLIPENSNHVVSDWLSRGFYSALLRDGVKILLFQNAMIHAKTATIDGEWSTIGTANIDRLSLTGNYEINMEIFDKNLAADMEKIYEVDSSNSRELTLREWDSRHVAARLSEAILAPLRPFL
ncbi:phospholipase D-like domain-containing protein [Arthrobacter roseus]|uniref:phospholipase D-like domain-containing protein n=1 Tax=Arthrobacter roseus TaxID=136274 RepID=UPI001EF75409|nr:phospholipase D-like domain-containing protein [Arthrobacter roseus]MBM7847046.1 cardiolipin synthase [Arthrobacter roseus]